MADTNINIRSIWMAVLCVFLLAPSLKTQDVALLENKVNGNLYCVAGNGYSQSAVTWIADITSDWKEPMSELTNRYMGDWICDLRNETCFHPPDAHDWYISSSLYVKIPLPHLTDYRWEGLPQTITLADGGVETLIAGPFTAKSIDLSIRADHDALIYLCNVASLQANDGTCYYITIGGKDTSPKSTIRECPPYNLNLDSPKNPWGECTHPRAQSQDAVIGSDHWAHIRIEWSSSFSVTKFGENKPFLSYKPNTAVSITNIFARTLECNGLWKIHNYILAVTHTAGKYLDTTYSFQVGAGSCIALQYFLTPGANLNIIIYKHENSYNFQEYQMLDDGEWHELYLILGSDMRSTRSPSLIRITSVASRSTSYNYFGIGNFRSCNPQGERRLSEWKRGPATCHVLQKPSLYLSPGTSNGSMESDCDVDKLKYGCEDSCRSLLRTSNCQGYAVCLPQGYPQNCQCAAGYEGYDCSTKVPDGLLLRVAPRLVQATHDSLTVLITDLQYSGTGQPYRIVIQYKKFRDKHWLPKPPEIYFESSPQLPIMVTIPLLQTATLYQIRAVLEDKHGTSYTDSHVPYINASTSCVAPQSFGIHPSKYNVTINYDITAITGHCPAKQFHYKVFDAAYGVLQAQGSLQNQNNTVGGLSPNTAYVVEITHYNTSIFSKNFRTDEAAPSKVQNLAVSYATARSLIVNWDPPAAPNGNITTYVVEYKHVKYLACGSGDDPGIPAKVYTSGNNIQIHYLLPYSKYRIEVWAKTKEPGESAFITYTTKSEDIPSETPEVIVKEVQETSLGLNWKVPKDCTTIKGSLDSTTVIIRGTSPWNENYISKKHFRSSDISDKDLIPYSSYDVDVYFNRSGKINSSAPFHTSITTKPAGPPTVKNLTAYAQGSDWISLRWKPPLPPYGVLKNYEINIYSMTHLVNLKSECNLWPGYICVTISEGIAGNYQYRVKVTAFNEPNLKGNTKMINVVTREQASSPPLNLKFVSDSSQSVTVMWDYPWQPSGKLQSFIVKAKCLNSLLLNADSCNSINITKELKLDKEDPNYSSKIDSLLPSSNYSIEVYAMSSVVGEPAKLKLSTSVTEPQFTQNVMLVEGESGNNSATILLPPTPLYMTKNSSVLVVVTLLSGTMPDIEDLTVLNNKELQKLIMREVEQYEGQKSWIAAEIKLNSTAQKFVVGDADHNQTTSGYINHPLSPGSSYQVHVVAITCMPTGCLLASTSLPEPVHTMGKSLAVTGKGSNGHFAFLLLLLIIPALEYVFYTRYCKKRKQSDIDGVPLHESNRKLESIKDTKLKDCPQVLYKPGSHVPVVVPVLQQGPETSIVATQQMSHRISVNMLEQYVRSAVVTKELQHQYEMFPRGSTLPCEYGCISQNRPKNRYGNLIPYDATRVVLKKIGHDRFSDYINANFVVGYKSPKFYIATQGPKSNTVAEFWRMVWQEQVQVISMLTNIIENGKKKCDKYWPDPGKEMTFGDMIVRTISVQMFADYTFSRLQVTLRGENRVIEHLHFTSWPDHGVPLYPLSVAAFLKKMSSVNKGPGPILVHCSAGVGRTGTIILADINIRMAAAEGAVDVLQYLQKIRECRLNLVDNIDQYKLVHFILVECLVEEAVDIPCDSNFKARLQTLRDTGGLDRQFLHITRKKEIYGTQDKEVIKKSPHRNRDRSVISGHRGELFFTETFPDDINCASPVFVDGFRMKNQFIATSFPVKDSVENFWSLLLEKGVSLVIVLNELDLRHENAIEFWPSSNDSMWPTSSIEVKTNQSNQHTSWNLHFLHVKSYSKTETVRLLQLKGWQSDESLPPSNDTLLQLWKEAERTYMGKGPILVTCRNGITACGLFTALAFLIEKVKLEQVCDVYHAVRTVCQSRTQFMDTQDQFEFLYDAVNTFLEDFEMYANFQ